MKQKMLLLAAVVFGVLAFMLTFQQISNEKRKIRSMAREVVLLEATRDISENDSITEDSIRRVKVSRFAEQLLQNREVPASKRNMIIGSKALFPISKGTILQWSDLQSSSGGNAQGVTRLIRPGFRAISITVDKTSSVSGLVHPNSYVDLIGTFKFPSLRGDASMDTITLTILQRVRVIATGSDYGASSSGGSYGTVTLELTPKEAEMIVFATQKGRVQMSLRNYEDAMVAKDTQSVNWKYLQDNIGKYTKEREQNARSGGY